MHLSVNFLMVVLTINNIYKVDSELFENCHEVLAHACQNKMAAECQRVMFFRTDKPVFDFVNAEEYLKYSTSAYEHYFHYLGQNVDTRYIINPSMFCALYYQEFSVKISLYGELIYKNNSPVEEIAFIPQINDIQRTTIKNFLQITDNEYVDTYNYIYYTKPEYYLSDDVFKERMNDVFKERMSCIKELKGIGIYEENSKEITFNMLYYYGRNNIDIHHYAKNSEIRASVKNIYTTHVGLGMQMKKYTKKFKTWCDELITKHKQQYNVNV